MFLSGLPGAEKPAAQKAFLASYPPKSQPQPSASFTPRDLKPENDTYEQYKAYRERTSIIVPMPPSIYRPLPQFIKTFLGDYGMYRFDENKDGREAIEQGRRDSA